MNIEVTGDTEALASVVSRIGKAAGALGKGVFATRLGVWARTDVQRGFAAAQDLDGTPWAPLARGSRKPLNKTGRLASSVRMTSSSKGFELFTNVRYAPFHQFGAKLSARFQPRAKSGRFKSRKAAAAQKRGAVRVTRIGPGEIPARPFLPGESMPDRWQRAFEREAEQFAREFL